MSPSMYKVTLFKGNRRYNNKRLVVRKHGTSQNNLQQIIIGKREGRPTPRLPVFHRFFTSNSQRNEHEFSLCDVDDNYLDFAVEHHEDRLHILMEIMDELPTTPQNEKNVELIQYYKDYQGEGIVLDVDTMLTAAMRANESDNSIYSKLKPKPKVEHESNSMLPKVESVAELRAFNLNRRQIEMQGLQNRIENCFNEIAENIKEMKHAYGLTLQQSNDASDLNYKLETVHNQMNECLPFDPSSRNGRNGAFLQNVRPIRGDREHEVFPDRDLHECPRQGIVLSSEQVRALAALLPSSDFNSNDTDDWQYRQWREYFLGDA